ncbi:MAG: hypothetical protein KDJ88_02345 [Bauldia sp.]|nr:hypothetical protein [Bauldia sp.]
MEHADRGLRSTDRDAISRGDLLLLLQIPILKAAALTLPGERWLGFCRLIASGASNRKAAEAVAAYFAAPSATPVDADSVALEARAARLEHFMQILAGKSGAALQPRLTGREGLESALAAQRGAVLWVAHFAYAPLAAKAALMSAGHRTWHMSRPEHGFSKTRFGIAALNPLRWRVEERYLAGRILIDRKNPAAATLRARRLLGDNGIVSITAGDWEGARVLEVPFGPGTVGISNGAPALAHLAGAALIPVVTVRESPGAPIDVILLPPLLPDRSASRNEWVEVAAGHFAEQVAPYVTRFPGQWRDWRRWKPSPKATASGAA